MKDHGYTAGPVRLILCYLLTLVLTVLLTCAALSTVLIHLDAPGDLFVHTTDAALDLQLARIHDQLRSLAQTWHFDPEPVCALFPRDRLQALNRQAVTWWRQLVLEDSSPNPPVFSDSAIASLVRDDPGFQAVTEPTMRRIVAEDRVAYVICETVQHAVYPLRTQLIGAALPRVNARIDLARIVPLLRRLPPALAGCAVLVLLLIVFILRHREGMGVFIGSALIAAAVLALAVLGLIHWLDLAGQAGLVSAILAAELSVLGHELALYPCMCSAAMAVLGLCLHMVSLRNWKGR